MYFHNFFLKSFRLLLFPFAILYGLGVQFRNYLYNKGYLKSIEFNFPIICVGNLSVGGTGKSPMVEYLIAVISKHFPMGVVSRGYRRKTRGYILADDLSTAIEIGDEPMQFHAKFPDVSVAVCEERLLGIAQILQEVPHLATIVLDDAFQHRKLRAGFNILLTDYSNPYYHDLFMPTGDLRDQRTSSKRAHIIVVTKCKATMIVDEKEAIIKKVNPLPFQRIFFTTLEYATPYHLFDKNNRIQLDATMEVLLVCAIANPEHLKDLLERTVATYYQISFPNHYIYKIEDIHKIEDKFLSMHHAHKIILTTEKDAMRLYKFKPVIEHFPIFVIPIQHQFLFDEQINFEKSLLSYIQHYPSPPFFLA
ncbi:MAG: tetraacyldisaccharide 4'-kinase [Phycisphaerales bacterium]|nr:tetraacyldisaccharide 4'-kinase [Phycisphaerales bacterium]